MKLKNYIFLMGLLLLITSYAVIQALDRADTEAQVKEINEEYDKEFDDPALDRSND